MSFSGQTFNKTGVVVRNHPFYPGLVLDNFVSTCAIPAIGQDILRLHLAGAMIEVNARLESFRLQQVRAGYYLLEKVPADQIDNQSQLCALYFQAVFMRAKARVLRDYPAIDRREAAENQAKSAPETEMLYERWSDEAIHYITGKSNIRAVLV